MKSSLVFVALLGVFLIANYDAWQDRVEWLREINGVVVVAN